uniref:Putative carboxypeptidase inhibitor n=1 Tax=Hyalomma excavatum TaxID=257692 RepID=A0A131XFM0_9ACAR
MLSIRVLSVLCLVSAIFSARTAPSACESSGYKCKFLLFCWKENRVNLPGCGFLKTCCRVKEQTCQSVHGTCQPASAPCAGLKHGHMPCGNGMVCCVPTVH